VKRSCRFKLVVAVIVHTKLSCQIILAKVQSPLQIKVLSKFRYYNLQALCGTPVEQRRSRALLCFLLSFYACCQLPTLQCVLLACPRHAPVVCQCHGCSFISVA